MAVKITMKAVDTKGKPVGLSFKLYTFNSTGSSRLLLTKSSSKATGLLSGSITLPTSTYMPHLYWKVYVNKKWVEISEKPVKYSKTSVDFGTVTVNTGTVSSFSVVATPIAAPVAISSSDVLNHSLFIEKKNEVTALKGEKTALSADVTRLESSLASVRKNLSDSEAEVTILEREKNDLNGSNKSLLSSIETYKSQVAKVESERDSFRSQLDSKAAQVVDLKKQLDEANPGETEISKVFENTGEQLSQVNQTLKNKKSAFRLKNVNLELKVLPSQDGSKVKLADSKFLKDMSDTSSLSVLKIDFASQADPESEDSSPAINVPDLEGYTKSQVIRVLGKMGINYQWRFESLRNTRNQKAKHGRVINQYPKANSPVNSKSTVFVTIGQADQL